MAYSLSETPLELSLRAAPDCCRGPRTCWLWRRRCRCAACGPARRTPPWWDESRTWESRNSRRRCPGYSAAPSGIGAGPLRRPIAIPGDACSTASHLTVDPCPNSWCFYRGPERRACRVTAAIRFDGLAEWIICDSLMECLCYTPQLVPVESGLRCGRTEWACNQLLMLMLCSVVNWCLNQMTLLQLANGPQFSTLLNQKNHTKCSDLISMNRKFNMIKKINSAMSSDITC